MPRPDTQHVYVRRWSAVKKRKIFNVRFFEYAFIIDLILRCFMNVIDITLLTMLLDVCALWVWLQAHDLFSRKPCLEKCFSSAFTSILISSSHWEPNRNVPNVRAGQAELLPLSFPCCLGSNFIFSVILLNTQSKRSKRANGGVLLREKRRVREVFLLGHVRCPFVDNCSQSPKNRLSEEEKEMKETERSESWWLQWQRFFCSFSSTEKKLISTTHNVEHNEPSMCVFKRYRNRRFSDLSRVVPLLTFLRFLQQFQSTETHEEQFPDPVDNKQWERRAVASDKTDLSHISWQSWNNAFFLPR